MYDYSVKIGPNLKFISFYLIVFYTLTTFGAVALHNYKRSHYSKAILEDMITTTSALRDTTNNPCQYTIYGDPQAPGTQYVKINLLCPNGQKTISTLSLNALPNTKLTTILKEYARILGFDLHLLDTWKCFVENKPVISRDIIVTDKSQIVCSYGKS